jgi:hypothetical protein
MLRAIAVYLAIALVILAAGKASYAQAQTGTGFYYPTGTSNLPPTGGTWLATGCDTYVAGKYHLGYDMLLPRTQPVHAISKGVVKRIIQTKHSNSIDLDPDVCFVWIEHRVKDSPTGTPYAIVAVYGHIEAKPGLAEGAAVEPYDEVGYVLPYPASEDHLHFGVNTNTVTNVQTFNSVPYYYDGSTSTRAAQVQVGWGRGSFGDAFPSGWCSQRERNKPLLPTRGYVDPLGFIRSKYPAEDTAVGTADTIYVGTDGDDSDGDDSRDGRTWDRRVRTIARAVSLVNAGGTIRAGGGNYREEAWPLLISKQVRIVSHDGGIVHVGR